MTNQDRKTAIRALMESDGLTYAAAARAYSARKDQYNGHDLVVVTDPDRAMSFADGDAILEFGGYLKDVGPYWNLYMTEDVYTDTESPYMLGGGGPESAPISAAVAYLDKHRTHPRGGGGAGFLEGGKRNRADELGVMADGDRTFIHLQIPAPSDHQFFTDEVGIHVVYDVTVWPESDELDARTRLICAVSGDKAALDTWAESQDWIAGYGISHPDSNGYLTLRGYGVV